MIEASDQISTAAEGAANPGGLTEETGTGEGSPPLPEEVNTLSDETSLPLDKIGRTQASRDEFEARMGWIAYDDAAAIIRKSIGAEPWPLIKAAIQSEALQARGRMKGALRPIRPVWFDCLAELSGSEAQDSGMVWHDNDKARKESDWQKREAPMPEHVTGIELRASDVAWLAATCAGQPRPDEVPPAGRTFVDVAVAQIVERLSVSEDRAGVLLVDALMAGRGGRGNSDRSIGGKSA
jgi:hypothetical protein